MVTIEMVTEITKVRAKPLYYFVQKGLIYLVLTFDYQNRHGAGPPTELLAQPHYEDITFLPNQLGTESKAAMVKGAKCSI